METNNQTRAYVVQLTEFSRLALTAFDFTFAPKETFKAAQPLDLDALRLVLEAAGETAKAIEFGGGSDDFKVTLQDAIAKLESLVR